jgi:hypothetical protein
VFFVCFLIFESGLGSRTFWISFENYLWKKVWDFLVNVRVEK